VSLLLLSPCRPLVNPAAAASGVCHRPELLTERVFTALHGMQTWSSHETSVCPSVRLSVKRVDCDKTKEKSVEIFYTIRKIIYPSFLRKRTVGGGRPYLPEILGQPTTRWSEIADFEQIIARSASAVTLSEKSSINTK